MSSISRRRALGLMAVGAASSVDALACAEPHFVCTDTAGLDDAAIAARRKVEYADRTPLADRRCDVCVQYVTAARGVCGGCKVLAGPIHPAGSCTIFARG